MPTAESSGGHGGGARGGRVLGNRRVWTIGLLDKSSNIEEEPEHAKCVNTLECAEGKKSIGP